MCGNHPELRQRTAPVSCQNPGAKAQMTNETGRSAKQTAAVARLSPQPPPPPPHVPGDAVETQSECEHRDVFIICLMAFYWRNLCQELHFEIFHVRREGRGWGEGAAAGFRLSWRQPTAKERTRSRSGCFQVTYFPDGLPCVSPLPQSFDILEPRRKRSHTVSPKKEGAQWPSAEGKRRAMGRGRTAGGAPPGTRDGPVHLPLPNPGQPGQAVIAPNPSAQFLGTALEICSLRDLTGSPLSSPPGVLWCWAIRVASGS